MIVTAGIKRQFKPTKKQAILLDKHFGANRFIWNRFLESRKTAYQENKKTSNYYKDAKILTELKQKKEFKWLYEVSSVSLQRTLDQLNDAYKRFFKKHSQFPNFKKKRFAQSYTLVGKIRVKGNMLFISKFMEGLKFKTPIEGVKKINNVTIRRTAGGKYYFSLSVEIEKKSLPKSTKKIGIDLGLKDFLVRSDGERVKAFKPFVKTQAKMKEVQVHLSRKKKGSSRFKKQKLKVGKLYDKITNCRANFLHQSSAKLIRSFGFIALEDLAVKNLVQNHRLAKHIADVSWGEFIRQLEYKSEWYGRNLVQIDRFYPSSKTCNSCGFINQDLTLKDRTWECGGCKKTLDRDLNAAKNILIEGLKLNREGNSRLRTLRDSKTRPAQVGKANLGEASTCR